MACMPNLMLNNHMSSVGISVLHKLIAYVTLEARFGMYKKMFFQVVFVLELLCTNVTNVFETNAKSRFLSDFLDRFLGPPHLTRHEIACFCSSRSNVQGEVEEPL